MIDQPSISLNNKFSVKVVSQIDDLANLRDDWDKLASKHGSYMPFLCFDWFRLWIEHFLDNHQLLVLLLYEHGDLQTIAPLLIKQQRFKGIPVRKIELIGNVYSPIQTFLFKEMDNKRREEYISLILQYCSRINKNWDIIDLQSIPEEDETFQLLDNALKKSRLKNKEYFCFGNCYLDRISYSSDTYFKHRSRNFRRAIQKSFGKAQRAGELEFKMITSSTDIDKYMKIYFEVYSKSWKKQERFGPNFYMDWTKRAAQKGWLRLGLVFLDNVPIAAGFAIVCDGFAYFEKTAYDEQYKNLGAGTIWYAEMIKYLIDIDKVSVIDLLREDYGYKKSWTPQRRERKGVLIFNNNLKGNYLSFLIRHIAPGFDRNRRLRKIKAFATKKLFKTHSS